MKGNEKIYSPSNWDEVFFKGETYNEFLLISNPCIFERLESILYYLILWFNLQSVHMRTMFIFMRLCFKTVKKNLLISIK